MDIDDDMHDAPQRELRHLGGEIQCYNLPFRPSMHQWDVTRDVPCFVGSQSAVPGLTSSTAYKVMYCASRRHLDGDFRQVLQPTDCSTCCGTKSQAASPSPLEA